MSVMLLEAKKYKSLYWGLAERYVKLCGRTYWHTNEPTFLLSIFEPKCRNSLAEAPLINETDGIKNIRYFVLDLQLMNQFAFKSRYEHRCDNEIPKINLKLTNLKTRPEYLNNCALLKCLHCIRYNCYEAEGNNIKDTFEKLNNLIKNFTSLIINNLPEYQNAKWD
ncbi:hypothetical protein ES708_21997 [subsurface metagenome]